MQVSVALCTYNGERYLEDQLHSLRLQTRLPDELVVCDDASTDQSLRIVEGVSAFPVRIYRNDQNIGSTANFFRAFSLCEGDLIFPCDQDDYWHPTKIARTVEAFQDNPDAALIFCNARVVDASLNPTPNTMWDAIGCDKSVQSRIASGDLSVLLDKNYVQGTACAFRADVFRRIPPPPPSWIHDEWVAFCCQAISRCVPVDLIALDYRQHEGQQIGATNPKARPLGRLDALRHATKRLSDALAALDRHLRTDDREAIQSMIQHRKARMEAAQAKRWNRVPIVLREVRRGGYTRHARGWKSALADLLL